jgi:hypothetical protein
VKTLITGRANDIVVGPVDLAQVAGNNDGVGELD